MKDPLQKEQTPYEVLGVDRDATTEQIHRALGKRLEERASPKVVTAAGRTLRDPEQRALVDLFLYDPQVLARLTPNPLEDPSALGPAHRASLATAWERQLKRCFPDLGIIHALAVQWYWRALYEEERLAEMMGIVGDGAHEAKMDGGSSAPAVEQLWQKAIAYWVMLACSDEFWTGPDWIPADRTPQVRDGLIARLRSRFHDLSQQYREHGAHPLVAHGQELELALTTELRTAKGIAQAGIRTAYGLVCCGPILLRHVGLFEKVKEQVDDALEKSPADKRLLSLRAALSPYSSVAVLIDNKRFDAALAAIEALPESERSSKEVSDLRARAHHELGKEQASLGEVDNALHEWEAALSCSPPKDTADQIRASIVSTCQAQAAKLQQHRRDEAIALLEKALELAEDKGLMLTLGEILAQRGIDIFKKAQDKAQREKEGMTRAIMADLKRGLADLERAAKLGSKRAKDQAKVARDVLEQAKAVEEARKSGLLGLPEAVQSLLGEANKAAGAKDWDTAIKCYRQALKRVDGKARGTLTQHLVVLLSNRATEKANHGVEMLSPPVDHVIDEEEFARMIAENPPRPLTSYECALCGSSTGLHSITLGETFGTDFQGMLTSFPPAKRAVSLCETCLKAFRASQTGSRPRPTQTAIRAAAALLRSAQKDLREAAQLDPANKNVKKNLATVNDLLSKTREPARDKFSSPLRLIWSAPRLIWSVLRFLVSLGWYFWFFSFIFIVVVVIPGISWLINNIFT
ncbi:MAG: hypothetical protein A2Y61_02835 [Chloroflexi bacterium RBG_13_60_13]|nr:MAG: hypothetical protein A2Y61_02835 [Chloroflexi bacterium RBG_13_60_13]